MMKTFTAIFLGLFLLISTLYIPGDWTGDG